MSMSASGDTADIPILALSCWRWTFYGRWKFDGLCRSRTFAFGCGCDFWGGCFRVRNDSVW